MSESVALGPVAGADLNLFLWDNDEVTVGNDRITDPRPNTFIFAGLNGRLDVGGKRVLEVQRYEAPPLRSDEEVDEEVARRR